MSKKETMHIIETTITRAELKTMAEKMFGNLVKAVVDVRLQWIAVDAELHADEEALLLEKGSRQEDLWGINFYPELDPDNPAFIEFDSMINLRPSQGNRTRGVENQEIKRHIIAIVRKAVI
jgi:hypothetical protein